MPAKWILMTGFLLFIYPVQAQPAKATPLSGQAAANLFILGKTWGFLKYHHPQVTAGKFNWDQELLKEIRVFRNIRSVKERNDTLLAWIGRLGDVPVCKECDNKPLKNARLVPDYSWMRTSGFSPDLENTLRFIQQNRTAKTQYYLQSEFDSSAGLYVGAPFHEPQNYKITYPDTAGYCMLALFRFWNYMEYWYPYKYGLPVSWDEVLKKFIPIMYEEQSVQQYIQHVNALAAALHDSHVFTGYFKMNEITGKYILPFTLKYIEGKFMVTGILSDSLAAGAGIKKGDIIIAIDKKTPAMFVTEQENHVAASNRSSFYNKLSYYVTKTAQAQSNITVLRNNKPLSVTCYNILPRITANINFTPAYFPYEKDSAYCLLPGKIVYMNMSLINNKDSLSFNRLVTDSKAMIIDLRQNMEEGKGTNAFSEIVAMLVNPQTPVFKFTGFNPSYPGTFIFTKPLNFLAQQGMVQRPVYKNKVAVLVNENTMSIGEFMTMFCQKAADVTIIGTSTAGADGGVSNCWLPGGINISFTGMGVYYPNGKETQRVGIQPDVVVKQTLKGYTENTDEQLNAAVKYLHQYLIKHP